MIKVRVAGEYLAKMMTQGSKIENTVEAGLPEGCKLIRVENDPLRYDEFVFIFIEPGETRSREYIAQTLGEEVRIREIVVIMRGLPA